MQFFVGALMVPYVEFVLSLFVPLLAYFRCLALFVPLLAYFQCLALFVPLLAYFQCLALFVPLLAYFRCLGKAMLRDCTISWVLVMIFLQF